MNVVLLGPFPPPHGGVQTNLAAIRRLLLERQIPCSVVNLTRFREAEGDEVYYPKSALKVLRILLKRRHSIIHLHIGGTVTFRELVLAMFCALLPWSRTVLTFHSGGYPSSAQGRTAHPWTLRGAVFRRFDAIIAVNAAIAQLFRDFGVKAERIHVIAPDSVPPAQADSAMPRVLGGFLETHDPVLLSVGGLEPEYDIPLQLAVLPQIIERFPNAGLAIIGEGSLREELRARIAAGPCSDRVLLCGDVAHEATLEAILQSSVLLRTSWYDGDSIAVREGLALGTPVIATDNGMRPDGVRLIGVSDARALRERIEAVLEQPRSPRTKRKSDDSNIAAVLSLYTALCSPSDGGRLRHAETGKRA